MKKYFLVGCSILLISTWVTISLAQSSKKYTPPITYTGMVVSVTDGDTFTILRNGKKETIRVLWIDTPEKFTTRTGYEECYWKESSDYATKTLYGKIVTVEQDSTQDKKDNYGRSLWHIFLSDGSYYEEAAIKNGYAFRYVYRKITKYDTRLLKAEQEAKKNNTGVWSKCEGKRKPVEKEKTNTGTIIKKPILIPPVIINKNPITSINNSYSCSTAKNICGQMNSCEEAKFYLNSCGLWKLDRDKDGTPCETLCK